jgi:hypothetical protein
VDYSAHGYFLLRLRLRLKSPGALQNIFDGNPPSASCQSRQTASGIGFMPHRRFLTAGDSGTFAASAGAATHAHAPATSENDMERMMEQDYCSVKCNLSYD